MIPRLLANQGLILANRIAPIFNCIVLTAYALSGKRLSIVLGDAQPDGQKAVVATQSFLREQTKLTPFERWMNIFHGGP